MDECLQYDLFQGKDQCKFMGFHACMTKGQAGEINAYNKS